MNLRSFTVFSSVAMLALGGCIIVGNNPNGTGGGGSGGTGGTGGNDVGVGSTGSGMTCTPSTGEETKELNCSDGVDNDCDTFTDDKDPDCAVVCEPPSNADPMTMDPGCYTCAEWSTPALVTCDTATICTTANNPNGLDSTGLYNELNVCACKACEAVPGCMDSWSCTAGSSAEPSAECNKCLIDTYTGACSTQATNCANDA